MYNHLFLLIMLLGTCWMMPIQQAMAQEADEEGGKILPATLVDLNLGLHFPAFDMAKRYGLNGGAGLGLAYKTANNWIIGAEGNFYFGRSIRDSLILQNLVTDSGVIVGEDGLEAGLFVQERGFQVSAKLGKVFPIDPINKPNSGWLVLFSVGYLQHKLRLEDQFNSVPQTQGEYSKGYDRLTGGLALRQFFGYLNLAENRRINYYVGLELTEGFTRSMRDFNFDTGMADTANRLDMLIALKLGWILPLYGKTDGERYYID